MPQLSRRRFVELGLGGTLALGLAGGLFRWFRAGYALRAGEVALALSDKQLSVARALVDALVPGGDGMPSGVELGVHQQIDEQVWAAEPFVAADLRAALELVEHVPPLLGHFGRLSSLDREARRAVVESMLRSQRDLFVQVAFGLKQLVHMLYYAHEAVWPHIGYDGPWQPEAVPPDSALRYAEMLQRARGRT